MQILLILGMNEGLVPKAKADNAILNDSDLLRMKMPALPFGTVQKA